MFTNSHNRGWISRCNMTYPVFYSVIRHCYVNGRLRNSIRLQTKLAEINTHNAPPSAGHPSIHQDGTIDREACLCTQMGESVLLCWREGFRIKEQFISIIQLSTSDLFQRPSLFAYCNQSEMANLQLSTV